jgi:hypothetical protein
MKFNSFTFFLIIIIIIYIYCYFIFPSNIQILQTNIDDFNFSLLYLRQPIVIPDYLEEKEKLINSWFNYNSISYNNNNNNNNNWNHNHNKYLFISAVEDTEVIIYKASVYSKDPEEDDRIIAIKLEKNQSLIIPFKWKYHIKRDEVELWEINDLITSFLHFFL